MKVRELLNNPGFVALMGTIFGGAGLKFVEQWLGRRAAKREDTRDYRGEITELVNRLDRLEKEVAFWRNRFYEEQENNTVLRIAMINGGLKPPPQIVRPPTTEAPV